MKAWWKWLRGGLGTLVAILAILVLVGWGAKAPLLAIVGMLGLSLAILVDVWQRHCLTGVTYSRELGQRRAGFGEEIPLTVSFTNDKLLPLTWLHTEDELHSSLTVRGARVNDFGGPTRTLDELVSMRPFQKVERRMTVVCDRRGVHRFGPARIRSGDPLGYREQRQRFDNVDELLVYPKIFALGQTSIVSRVPLGDTRAERLLVEDPMRIIGHREYRDGDPFRQIDWRATARSRTPLVRVCERTATLSVAIFLDTSVPQLRGMNTQPQELEFAIAVAASIATDLARRNVGIGLFSNGMAERKPIGLCPNNSPDVLPHILELLARTSPFGPVPFDHVLHYGAAQLPAGASVVVVAADYPEQTLVAMNEVRRRQQGLTAIFVDTDEGSPPHPELVDLRLKALYCDDWHTRSWLDLAS